LRGREDHGGMSMIEITFTGMADGIDPQLTSDPVNYSINAFVSPYTLTYQFDNGNLLSASLTLDALNFTVGPGINWNLWGLGYLDINSSSITANAGGSYLHLFITTNTNGVGTFGFFQTGLCPGINAPCGQLTSIDSFNIVPGPTVGDVPLSMLLLCLFIWFQLRGSGTLLTDWWQRRKKTGPRLGQIKLCASAFR
jgi:hypothetical protein